MTVVWGEEAEDLRKVQKPIDLAQKVIYRNVILDAEFVEQCPLRNLPRPHHPPNPPILERIESGLDHLFKAGFLDTIYTYGTFGFSTPENRLPDSSVNYSGNYHTYMVARFDGEPELVHIEDGKMDVDVDFATGDVSGTLFERDLIVSDPGDPFRELNISIGVENGKVEGSGFSGDLAGSLGVNGAALTTAISNDGVDGFFFGNDADVLAGTYEADFTASAADETISGSLAGVFHGERE